MARGWVALRGGRDEEAAASFTRALSTSKRDRSALVGLGVSRLKQGNAPGAIEALARISPTAHDALSMTYLAEARLAAGDAGGAEQDATVAIDEMDFDPRPFVDGARRGPPSAGQQRRRGEGL